MLDHDDYDGHDLTYNDYSADNDPGDCTDHHRREYRNLDDNGPGAGDNHNHDNSATDDGHRTVYCTYCHKYHSVTTAETPCSTDAWVDIHD